MSTEKIEPDHAEFVRQQSNAQMSIAIHNLVDAGYDPVTVVDALVSGDMTRLKHTGHRLT